MTLAPVKTPVVAKKMFPNYIWDIPTQEKVIYLTFDDGPTPEITNWTLDLLNQYHAKATFFCIGANIEKHPDIFKRTILEGHAIGNHTQNHIKGWKNNTKNYLKNIAEAKTVIEHQMLNLGAIKFFRPPYGQITPKQGRHLIALDYKIIMWDILSFDWDHSVDKETCLKNILAKTTQGSIVVFHDSIKASKNMQYTLPRMLDYFNDKGFRFESLQDAIQLNS
ncbi:polysaccharide deacetylase family protein [Algibacter mikhailovii]|uniref:polysaccharide deacetylase family protein n=1 Tax=Algibacter mikhailovii TaxID=425498 RepID=UPI002495144F|nr:polysaccharide deacetylase family protein [Algibacter mikhailovii]